MPHGQYGVTACSVLFVRWEGSHPSNDACMYSAKQEEAPARACITFSAPGPRGVSSVSPGISASMRSRAASSSSDAPADVVCRKAGAAQPVR